MCKLQLPPFFDKVVTFQIGATSGYAEKINAESVILTQKRPSEIAIAGKKMLVLEPIVLLNSSL